MVDDNSAINTASSEHESRFRQQLEQRIEQLLDQAIEKHGLNNKDDIYEEITQSEMKRFYTNYFSLIKRQYGKITVSNAAAHKAYDRTNLKRIIRKDGLDMQSLIEEVENEIERDGDSVIPESILNIDIIFYRSEFVKNVVEIAYYTRLLEKKGGKVYSAAREIKTDCSNFRGKLRRLGIDPNNYRNY